MNVKRQTAIYVSFVNRIASAFANFKKEVRKLEGMSYLDEKDPEIRKTLAKINRLADDLYGEVSDIPNYSK